jgi:flagella basal body P-ring formation protein FlgA
MIKFLFALIFSFKLFAEPCNLEVFSKIYKFESNQILNSKEIVKSSNCNEDINHQIAKLLTDKSGELSISSIEKKLLDQKVHITPRTLSIIDLSTTLKDQLSANSNLFFLDIKSLNNLRSISITENESLKVTCESCQTVGEKNIKIEVQNTTTNNTDVNWISSKIFTKIKVIKAKNTLSFQQKQFSTDDFYTEDTLTMMSDNILGSLDHIQFFKPNKTILQGSIITNMDIQPVYLVNYGTPVKINLKNQAISLTKFASPTRSAQFGESVELKINNEKTITGKVVDYNQVVIEL